MTCYKWVDLLGSPLMYFFLYFSHSVCLTFTSFASANNLWSLRVNQWADREIRALVWKNLGNFNPLFFTENINFGTRSNFWRPNYGFEGASFLRTRICASALSRNSWMHEINFCVPILEFFPQNYFIYIHFTHGIRIDVIEFIFSLLIISDVRVWQNEWIRVNWWMDARWVISHYAVTEHVQISSAYP